MKKIIMFLLALTLVTTYNIESYAREVKEDEVVNQDKDKWIEIQSITLPFDLPITSGITAKGNPKYWFTFKDIGEVSISAANYKKYSKKTEYIELVKWQKGNKYKYTTRAKSKANIDLTKIFEK